MNKYFITTAVAVLALLLAGAAIIQANTAPPIVLESQGVSNFDSIHLSDLPEGTATPVFIADLQSGGSANVAEFRVASTPVWYVTSGGNTVQTGTDTRSGNLDLNGNDLIIDTDGDSILDENTDDAIRLTLGGATGTFSVLTGNFKVGNGSPSTAQDAEDAYVEGGFEVDGTTRLDGAVNANSTLDVDGNISSGTGAITATDNVIVDGAADAEQLVIQGYSTQTNNPFVIEQSDGTDKFTVSNAGNVVVAGTSDLQGNVSDSGGTLTVADNAAITGQADAEQLVVTGYTTQTNSLFVVEDSSNSDIFEVESSQINANNNPIVNIGAAGTDFGTDGSLTTAQTVTVSAGGLTVTAGGISIASGALDADGAVTLNSTVDIDGNISSGTGAITITDNVLVDGAADAEQLIVQGNGTQTNNIFVVEQSDGTDVGTISNAGLLTLGGGVTVSNGNAQVNDFIIADAASAIDATGDAVITPTGTYQQLTASGSTTPTVTTSGITAGTILVLINTAAQDILIQDSGTMMLTGDLTLNQYDSLMLWFDGTNWIEISTSNN